MKRFLSILICGLTFTTSAQSAPGHCWKYIHAGLKENNLNECVSKAEVALEDNGYAHEVRNSSDQYITYVRTLNDDISAHILCYDVKGERGDVLAVITVAGNSACRVADSVFRSMMSK